MICNVKSCYSMKIPKTSSYFKEDTISEILCIPLQKPDMERVLDVNVWPELEDYELVETKKGRSYEGQYLTGLKLVIEVRIKSKVTYVADKSEQPVHAAHFETLKSMFVIIPEEIDGKKTCDLVTSNSISITPYMEATHANMIDKRSIHECSLLLVDVRVC